MQAQSVWLGRSWRGSRVLRRVLWCAGSGLSINRVSGLWPTREAVQGYEPPAVCFVLFVNDFPPDG